jgi:hypothetical protein
MLRAHPDEQLFMSCTIVLEKWCWATPDASHSSRNDAVSGTQQPCHSAVDTFIVAMQRFSTARLTMYDSVDRGQHTLRSVSATPQHAERRPIKSTSEEE